MKTLLLISLSLISLFTACRQIGAPERAKGVPSNATWIGGVDGGKWFVIEKVDKVTKTAKIQIYNDNSGDLDINKIFKLQCDNSDDIKWDNLLSQITCYDGRIVSLSLINNNNIKCYFK